MRVGIAITSLHGGGAEFVARRWIDELLARGHTVHVYLYEPGTGRSDAGGMVDPRAQVHTFDPGSKVSRALRLPRWFRQSADQDGLDVMVSMLSYTNLACLLGWRLGPRPRTRLVISERNAPSTYLPGRSRSGPLQVLLARRWYRRADAVIAISHPVAGDLIGGYRVAGDRCFVVPNPVSDLQRSTELPVPRVRTAVALVGRLVDQKRPELFVRVIEELSTRPHLGEVVGVVVGVGGLEASMRAQAERAGVTLDFLGWREPWTAAIETERLDCLLLPSRVEGFGNVLVEAARHGLPSVACSEALGVADAIIPGITGEFAPTSRPVDIANAVERALRLDPSRPTLSGWLGRFSVDQSVDVLESVLAFATRTSGEPTMAEAAPASSAGAAGGAPNT